MIVEEGETACEFNRKDVPWSTGPLDSVCTVKHAEKGKFYRAESANVKASCPPSPGLVEAQFAGSDA
jgi:hypothetical protein